jgi:hypothetical protein
MKKVIVASAALFFAAITSLSAQTSVKPVDQQEKAVVENVVKIDNQERTPVKVEDLPAAVKATLAGEDYKGWIISSAFLVKNEAEYYEVSLSREKETKIVKLTRDGKAL